MGWMIREYGSTLQRNAADAETREEQSVPKKGPQSEMITKRTKTTASIPADLYGQMWHLIASERGAGRRLTAQDIMIKALREYLETRKKDAAA